MLYDTKLKKQADGTYFSSPHYSKVREAREEAGLPVADNNQDYDHPLIGRTLKDRETSIIYNIESCKKTWHLGWFYQLLLENNGSHCVAFWGVCEEQPCADDFVLKFIKKHQARFEILGGNHVVE